LIAHPGNLRPAYEQPTTTLSCPKISICFNLMSMKKFTLILIFITSLAGCGGGSDSSSGSGGSQPATELERLIVVIGDSIGTGFGASVAFPDLLRSMTGIPVVNISQGGTSAEFGVGRAPGLIEEYQPMYLVVLLGTNNAGGAGGGVPGAINSMQYVVDVANQAGVIPVIGTLPPIPRSTKENNNAAAISAGIRGIADARIAPINRSLGGQNIGSDGKHPNDSGQQIIASLFAQLIE
jgi:lysophospholipase L1-like esterase